MLRSGNRDFLRKWNPGRVEMAKFRINSCLVILIIMFLSAALMIYFAVRGIRAFLRRISEQKVEQLESIDQQLVMEDPNEREKQDKEDQLFRKWADRRVGMVGT